MVSDIDTALRQVDRVESKLPVHHCWLHSASLPQFPEGTKKPSNSLNGLVGLIMVSRLILRHETFIGVSQPAAGYSNLGAALSTGSSNVELAMDLSALSG